MKELLSFKVCFFKKGDKDFYENLEELIFEKNLDDLVDEIKAEEGHIITNDSVFKEDAVGVMFQTTVGLGTDFGTAKRHPSGIKYEIEMIGDEEVFRPFIEDIIKIAESEKEFLEKGQVEYVENLFGDDDCLQKLITNPVKDIKYVTILTMWDYSPNCFYDSWSGGYECDPEYDLLGLVDASSIKVVK